jgi:endonuclease-3
MSRGSKSSAVLPSAKARVAKIIPRLAKIHPDAKLDLDFTNALELLIALILAAQARDDRVNVITAGLFKSHRAAADYASTPLPQLESLIKPLNFYRTKARAIQNCCKQLVARFGGKVPDRFEELLTLPGVGRKTANILLGNAFGRQTIGVDTHVMRLSQRLGFTTHTDPDKIELDLLPLVPENQRVKFCHLLQYHGRRVCVAKQPRCPQCAIAPLCPYPAKTQPQNMKAENRKRERGVGRPSG